MSRWACRVWSETALEGWLSDIEVFDTKEEAEQHGEICVRLKTRDETSREYEVYEVEK